MPCDRTNYKIELLCDYPEWWRYNVYIMAVGYDHNGQRLAFNNFSDRVHELGYGNTVRKAPEGWNSADRKCELITDPCDYVEVYLYAVANTFPASVHIKDSPPFEVTLKISAGGLSVSEQVYEVNQWGGLTIVAYRADKNDI